MIAEVGFGASLGNVLRKMYTAVYKIGYDFWAMHCTKSDTTLGKIGYDFGQL